MNTECATLVQCVVDLWSNSIREDQLCVVVVCVVVCVRVYEGMCGGVCEGVCVWCMCAHFIVCVCVCVWVCASPPPNCSITACHLLLHRLHEGDCVMLHNWDNTIQKQAPGTPLRLIPSLGVACVYMLSCAGRYELCWVALP